MSSMKKLTLLTLIALVSFLCLQAVTGSQKSSLKFTVPAGWIEEERTSSMRVAQYRLPKASPDTEDASLVLYYFGQGQGGSVTANLERWAGQIEQADGTVAKQTAKEGHFEANGLKFTTLDVSGKYVAETAPGSGSFNNKPGYRMLAAVVETPSGSYFVKLVGPENTVAHWNESFLSYLRSFEFK
jgi:hypothetical protein